MTADDRAQQQNERLMELAAREAHRETVKKAYDAVYGSRASASFDLRVNPATVSAVLNGRIRNDELLERLERWIADHPDGGQKGQA